MLLLQIQRTYIICTVLYGKIIYLTFKKLSDKNLQAKSGKTIGTADLGAEYGFTDVDGKQSLKNRHSINLEVKLLSN